MEKDSFVECINVVSSLRPQGLNLGEIYTIRKVISQGDVIVGLLLNEIINEKVLSTEPYFDIINFNEIPLKKLTAEQGIDNLLLNTKVHRIK